ncbi:MAG: rhodanese-like domain-containing protein, partial [Deltaproteobacteria bacterium]|nr:rhodanese-like domain-containing protein [Deltaproteobacteria bacterium]
IIYDAEALNSVYLIDVRSADAHDSGSLQNSINISLSDLVDSFGTIISNGAALTNIVTAKNAQIITYCDGFGIAQQFADAAAELGYTSVFFYKGGLTEWQSTRGDYVVMGYDSFKDWHASNFPFEDGKTYLISANARSWYLGEESQEGHIPGAVNIPSHTVIDDDGNLVDNGSALSSIAADTTAQMVIYCGSYTCGFSLTLARAAVQMGYSKVCRYQEGYDMWKVEGNEIIAGSDPY